MNMNDGYDADKEERMMTWERAAEMIFHDKTYVISYDYHPGIINMRVSFVQFPSVVESQTSA